MRWILIAAAPDIAAFAERAGVHQIMVDLETLGKAERQRGTGAHMSTHGLADVPRFAAALRQAELLVRVNPLGDHSAGEINQAIAGGAQRLMLPMFRTADEVAAFLRLVRGRVPVTLLVETVEALAGLADYDSLLAPADYIHFGLNDLSLALHMGFVFEVVAAGLLDAPAERLRASGRSFGIGGIGRVGFGEVPAEWVLGELVRLGADWVILSRAFHGSARSREELQDALDLDDAISQLRRAEAAFRAGDRALLSANHQRFVEQVRVVTAASAARA